MRSLWITFLLVLMLAVPASAQFADYPFYAARGKAPGARTVNKFGTAPDADNGVKTDVWDGADGTTSTDLWVAPTAARVHAIASTSIEDDADKGGEVPGTGALTVVVYGLTAWTAGTDETSETITMDGTTPVNTSNSYVIVYRMVVYTAGTGGTNAGIITATAATDSTVTAAIQTGVGQTEMAIYGVPDGASFYLWHVDASILKATGASALADGNIQVKQRVDQANSLFRTMWSFTLAQSSPYSREFDIPLRIDGPAIIKVQVTTTVDNSQVVANFDGIVFEE